MTRTKLFPLPLGVFALAALLSSGFALAQGNINPSQRYAWMEKGGWVDFSPSGGGVTVGATFLSGYAWAENAGWIKLGATGSGPYGNSSATNWGVNISGGTLSGYAWSETAGWIDFAPSGGGVTVDASTGQLTGYAWSETLGWMSFHGGTGPTAYGVAAEPAGGPDGAPANVPALSGVGLFALAAILGAAGVRALVARGA